MAHEITLPRLGWSMEQGTFLGWRKRDGEQVRVGDPLYELEGEKATQEIESLDSGILRIPPDSPPAGTVVAVGALLGYLVAEGEPAPFEAPPRNAPEQETASPRRGAPRSEQPCADEPASAPAAAPSVRRLARELGIDLAAVAGTGPAGRITTRDLHALSEKMAATTGVLTTVTEWVAGTDPGVLMKGVASPRARRVAAELGVDWKVLRGTGRSGRIRERDVRAAASAGHAGPSAHPVVAGSPAARKTQVAFSSRRRTIAQRMLTSSQRTAPVTLTTRVDATNLVNLRAQFKAVGRDAAVPSYTDILVKLAGAALEQHPLLAACWDGDELWLPAAIDIGVGVDTDDGLVVAVLRDVPALSLTELARRSRELFERARAGKLSAAEMQGGVFTISNLGSFGIDAFTPIINYPETAVLGIGRIRREPVVHNDQIVPRDQVTLSLTFDHRAFDGAPAARFLQTLSAAIENPSAWLLQM